MWSIIKCSHKLPTSNQGRGQVTALMTARTACVPRCRSQRMPSSPSKLLLLGLRHACFAVVPSCAPARSSISIAAPSNHRPIISIFKSRRQQHRHGPAPTIPASRSPYAAALTAAPAAASRLSWPPSSLKIRARRRARPQRCSIRSIQHAPPIRLLTSPWGPPHDRTTDPNSPSTMD